MLLHVCQRQLHQQGNNFSTSSFTANWTGVASDAGYELEVSTSSTFATLLSGYPLAIANNGTGIGSYEVSGLSSATTYYYRVRATGVTCSSPYSATQTVLTSCGIDTVPTVTQTLLLTLQCVGLKLQVL